MATLSRVFRHYAASLAGRKLLYKRYTGGTPLDWSEIQPYNAIRLNLSGNKDLSTEEFSHHLKSTYIRVHVHEGDSLICADYIKQWTKEGRSAIWLHIPVAHSGLIPTAVQHQFLLHHTLHEEIVLSRWLDESRPSKLPHFASHQVGVCGKEIEET